MIFKNWFMLGVHLSSYGCAREVGTAREKRKNCTRHGRVQLYNPGQNVLTHAVILNILQIIINNAHHITPTRSKNDLSPTPLPRPSREKCQAVLVALPNSSLATATLPTVKCETSNTVSKTKIFVSIILLSVTRVTRVGDRMIRLDKRNFSHISTV